MPGGFRDAFEAWAERCDDRSRVEYILCVDDRHWRHIRPVPSRWGSFSYASNKGRECAVDAWNTAAARSTGDILITVADDYFPPEHWDTAIVSALAAWGKFLRLPWPAGELQYVLDIDNQDNSSPLLPFSFISRAYYEKLGYLFWPEYFGLGADNDFTAVARRDGVVIDARNLKFTHKHPDLSTRIADEVDAWQHRPEAIEAWHRVFERREAEGFPALDSSKAEEYYRTLEIPHVPQGVVA